MGQLNIKDEALAERLRRLAQRRQTSVTNLLRAFADEAEAAEEERVAQRLAAIREVTQRSSAELSPKLTSDHGWLYDERGLPR